MRCLDKTDDSWLEELRNMPEAEVKILILAIRAIVRNMTQSMTQSQKLSSKEEGNLVST